MANKKTPTVGSLLDTMDAFLAPFQKKAAEVNPDDTQKGSVGKTPEVKELEKTDPVGTEQTNIGKEQQAESEAGGSTAASSAPENTDANAKGVVDAKKEIATMDADDKAKSQSVLAGETTKLTVGQQKAASLEQRGLRLIAALDQIVTAQQKTASQAPAPAPQSQAPVQDTSIDPLLEKVAAAAIRAGQRYAVASFLGQLDRFEKEEALRAGGLQDLVIQKYGSVQNLFEKMAAEDENALLPPELGGGEAPAEGAEALPLPPDASAGSGEEAPPMEGGGDVNEAEIQDLAQALSENVSPEDVAQAEQALQELQAAGATPEEIGQAVMGLVEEAVQEGEAGGGGEAAAAEPPPEEPAPEEPPKDEAEKSAALEKVAAERQAAIREYLRPLVGGNR